MKGSVMKFQKKGKTAVDVTLHNVVDVSKMGERDIMLKFDAKEGSHVKVHVVTLFQLMCALVLTRLLAE